MRCNSCLEPLEPGAQAAATKCLHLFCLPCAKKVMQSGMACPVCAEVLTKRTVRAVVLQRDPDDADLILCGQSPEFALSSCLAAFQFEETQTQLEVQLLVDDQHRQASALKSKMESAFRSKLEEVHGAYQKYRGRCKELLQERESLIQDKHELQDKYSQKTSIARRLQERCELKEEELRLLKRARGGADPLAYGPTARAAPSPGLAVVKKAFSGGSLPGGGAGARPSSARSGGPGAAGLDPYLGAPPPETFGERRRSLGGNRLGTPHEVFPMHGHQQPRTLSRRASFAAQGYHPQDGHAVRRRESAFFAEQPPLRQSFSGPSQSNFSI